MDHLPPDLWPYASLFGIAFLAATVLPAQSELVLTGMLLSGKFDAAGLLFSATAGNTLGSVVNWVLGRYIELLRHKRWFPLSEEALHRAQRWYRKWGFWSLLLSWAPVVGDGLTIIAGMLRVRLAPFVILVLIAKGGRYLAIAGAISAAGAR